MTNDVELNNQTLGELASTDEDFVVKFAKIWLEPRLPGSYEAVRSLTPLVTSIKALPFFKVAKSVRFLQYLQRIYGRAYIPDFSEQWILGQYAVQALIAELTPYYIYAVCAYGPTAMRGDGMDIDKDVTDNDDIETLLLEICDYDVECVLSSRSTQNFIPAHMLLLDHDRKEIVLVIRGSAEAADWVINLSGKLSNVGTHTGMHQAAKALMYCIEGTIDRLRAKHPDYSFAITGHSLGGGVACLVAVDWAKSNVTDEVRAYGFGCPRLMTVDEDAQLPANCRLTSVVFGRDFAPRSSYLSLRHCTRLIEWLVQTAEQRQKPIEEHSTQIKAHNLVRIIEKGVAEAIPPSTHPTNDELYRMAEAEYKKIEAHEKEWRKSLQTESFLLRGSFFRKKKRTSEFHDCLDSATFFTTNREPRDRSQAMLKEKMRRIENKWNTLEEEDTYLMTPPGRLIHIIPKAHFIDYCKTWPEKAHFENSCLFVEWPRKEKLRLVRDVLFTPESFSDHQANRYGGAICPNSFHTLPADFNI